jgi:predicted nucleic acid-binding protein
MIVLDASIAIKWFFADEPQHDLSLIVLDKLRLSPNNFIVPELFHIELGAVLLRKSKWDGNFASEAMETIYQLGIATVSMGKQMTSIGLKAACNYKLTLYDGVYIATSELVKGKWLSADQKALKKIPKRLAVELRHYCKTP